MRTLNICLFIGLFFLTKFCWSQSDCAKDFIDISAACIANTKKTFSSKSIPLSSIKKDAIYFYKTSAGEFGKLKILSVVNKPQKECSVFLEGFTYSSNSNGFTTKSSLSIGPEKNYWLADRLFLDRDGFSSIVLEKVSQEEIDKVKRKEGEEIPLKEFTSEQEIARSKATCMIVPSKGVEFAVYQLGRTEEKKFGEENNKLLYAPLVLIFISIFLIVRVFIEDQDKYKTQEALEEVENIERLKKQPLFLKLTRPFYKRYFLPIVQSSKHRSTLKTKYRQKLANAGLLKEMTPEEFFALKFFMILGGPFMFLAVRYVMESDWPLILTPVMGIVGFFYPNLWLSGMIKQRGDNVLRAMPFIVDMLALSVEAGLDFMAAIQKVIEKAPPSPLVEEFETLVKETKIGSSRAEGLRQMGWRINIIEINSFCATLIAADSVGASIGPLLKQLSSELRIKRSARAEQLGATAATKILIPMIFFILPAVMVAIFAPMGLKMISGKL
jgi:tight adherence protein C